MYCMFLIIYHVLCYNFIMISGGFCGFSTYFGKESCALTAADFLLEHRQKQLNILQGQHARVDMNSK